MGGQEALERHAVMLAMSAGRPTDERSTVRAAQRGSPDAIETLVRANWPDAYRLALGIVADAGLAEDVAQEAMINTIRSLDGFDLRRPFRPWLHRIVINRAIDQVRRARQNREVPLGDAPPEVLRGSDQAAGPVLPPALTDALMSLDERQRAVVTLRHVLDYSAREVGDFLDLSEANVRTISHRSLKSLREALGSRAPDEESADG
jgi:RNA polymerase sigma-70 factor (ECF subfamily)